MGNRITEVVEGPPSAQAIKVHARMCSELLKFVMRVSKIFPELEAARPRCTSGIEALCSLNNGIAKAESLLQSCRESSVLYLALTGNEILSRCKKSQDLLEQSLSQIQHMVPAVLATKISGILADLRSAAFCLDPPEEEAQRVLRELLCSNCSTTVDSTEEVVDSTEEVALAAIQTASSCLHIASKNAVLIEERSIRNLLHKFGKNQKVKRKILLFFLHLLNKYGKSLPEEQNDSVPLVELHVEEYASNGALIELASHNTCSMADRKLVDSSFTLNTTSINNWNSIHGVSTLNPKMQEMLLKSSRPDSLNSTISLGSSTATEDLNLRVDFSNVSVESGTLPWDSRCKEVEDIICLLEHNDKSWPGIPSKNFIELIVRFLKDACGLCDVEAQKSGCLLLFEFVQKHRKCVSYLNEDTYDLLATFLCTTVSKQSLLILEVLSVDQHCHYKIATSGALSCILDIIDGQIQEFLEPALTILCNLSTNGSYISSFIVPSKLIPILVPLFEDSTLASYCIVILKNMLDNKDTIRSVAETDGCIASIARLLEKADRRDQQHDVVELLQMLKDEISDMRKGSGEDIDVGLTKHHNMGFFQRFLSKTKCFSR